MRNHRLSKKMEKFLDAGIVDFFASDAHNTRYCAYSIEEDIRQLKNLVGAERAEILLYENAEKVIRNEEIKKERNYVEENTGIAGYFSGMFSGLLRRVGFGRGTDKS
jgi:tyrosine-protein phosphatase YwqE